MKTNATYISTLFLLITLAAMPKNAAAQDLDNPRSASIHVMTRASNDSVILRWAPDKPGAWHLTKSSGFLIERVRMTEQGKYEKEGYQKLTTSPITPWSLDEFKQRFEQDKTNKNLAVAAQLVYGKSLGKSKVDPDDELGQIKQRVNNLKNTYSLAMLVADTDPLAAEALGVRFVDRTVKAGGRYVYRIYPVKNDPTYAIDTAYVVVDAQPAETAQAPEGVQTIGGDGKITVKWMHSAEMRFSGFNVYRSDDGGATFAKLNKNPLVTFTPAGEQKRIDPEFTDTANVMNYRKYLYRVRGITPFGDMSEAAQAEGMARDLTPPPSPRAESAKQIGKSSVRISWKQERASSDIAGYMIGRGSVSKPASAFRWIIDAPLTKDARSFVDDNATEDEPYYIVASVDTASNNAPSFSVYAIIIDSLPPAPPQFVSGRIDTNGVVTLRWKANTEKDIDGYRVLWANDSTHVFGQRTPTVYRDTIFSDTVDMNTLTKNMYYKIIAVDNRYMHSVPTQVITLKRPDVIAPISPVFKNVSVTENSVTLSWNVSTSEDVVKHILSKRRTGDKEWKEIATLGREESQYRDTDVERRSTYEYRIIAVDDAGLRSEPKQDVQARPYDTGRRPGVSGVAAEYDAATRSVKVRWSNPSQQIAEKFWYVVYRSAGDAKPTQYRTVDATNAIFSDADIAANATYRYAVLLRTENGGESSLSEIAAVKVP